LQENETAEPPELTPTRRYISRTKWADLPGPLKRDTVSSWPRHHLAAIRTSQTHAGGPFSSRQARSCAPHPRWRSSDSASELAGGAQRCGCTPRKLSELRRASPARRTVGIKRFAFSSGRCQLYCAARKAAFNSDSFRGAPAEFVNQSPDTQSRAGSLVGASLIDLHTDLRGERQLNAIGHEIIRILVSAKQPASQRRTRGLSSDRERLLVQTRGFEGPDRPSASNRLYFRSHTLEAGIQVCTTEQLKAHLAKLIGQAAQPMVRSHPLDSPPSNNEPGQLKATGQYRSRPLDPCTGFANVWRYQASSRCPI
jgi:hypothetical protein